MAIAYDPSRSALYTPEQRETNFQAGGDYSPEQLAVEAARLAYYRAEASSPERERLTEALARVGFSGLTLFVDAPTGAAAFAARRSTDGVTLLAMRGTQPDDLGDIATDLRANTVDWTESEGRVHAGFAFATRALVPQFQKWIGDTKPDLSKLIVTGHSLGAAMATLVATIWRPGRLVTLGSPRVGDETFVATVAAPSILRFVDCCDVVTGLPPPVGGYTHLKTCAYVTRDGAILDSPPQAVIDADRHTARLEYLSTYAWKTGALMVRDLADHAPINYARALFP
jgi:Lipase (class 3)